MDELAARLVLLAGIGGAASSESEPSDMSTGPVTLGAGGGAAALRFLFAVDVAGGSSDGPRLLPTCCVCVAWLREALAPRKLPLAGGPIVSPSESSSTGNNLRLPLAAAAWDPPPVD
jgi:hypothetical protein